MALGNVYHFFNRFDVSSFLGQGLSHLEVVDSVRKLRDDAEDVLFNEMT